jgi:CzcA family heavy metal efflux pump
MVPAKVLLVDAHALFRRGVRTIIERDRDFQVVGEAENSRDALARARELHPDLIVMDTSLPDGGGFETVQALQRELPDAKVVVLSVHDKQQNLLEAVKGGADVFLSKDVRARVLLKSLRGVMRCSVSGSEMEDESERRKFAMLRGIVGTSLQYQFLVIVLAAAVLVFGAVQLGNMPVDVLPEFEPVVVEVQTEALGLSAEEIEALVTVNVEELLMGTPWVATIRSQSVPGLSSILLLFEPGTDAMLARQLVQERLNLAWGMPNVSKPPVILQPLSATNRLMMVALDSQEASPIAMSVLARWNIRPALMGIDGVANVSIWGQRRRQLQVQVDPEKLRAFGVTLDQIIETTGDSLWVSPLTFLNASTAGTGGWIDTPQQRIDIQHILPIVEPDELAQVPVAGTVGLRLADVANVVEGHQPLIGDALLDDGPGLLLVVEKMPGANTLKVTRQVEEKLDLLQPGLTGIEIDTSVFRPASFIEMAIGHLSTTLLIAALLVVVALGVFFFNWRIALISLVAILVSLVAALLALYWRGATINSMVLAGLVVALGILIDDAIVDVGNVARRLRQRRTEDGDRPVVNVVLEASAEMRGTIIFGTLIAALAVAPVFLMEGTSGLFYRPLALSYMLALLASTAVALTLTPALSLLLLAHAPLERRESPVLRWLERAYESVLAQTVMRTPRLAYVTVAVMVVASLVVLPFLRAKPLPKFKETEVVIRWEAAPGTSHPAMIRLATELSRELQTIPGVYNFASHIGRAILSDKVVGISSGEFWVTIDPTADYDQTLAALQEVVDGYPGLVRDVQTYLQETLGEIEMASSEDMVVRVFGRDFDVLFSKAEEVRQALAGIEGIVDLFVEPQIEEPYIEIEVDLARAEKYGVKPGDVRRAASTLLTGIEVGSLFEEQKVFDVVVWGTPETRHSLTSVRELLIDTPGGDHVRLQDVADVRVASALTTINREAISRRIDVSFGVRGRTRGAVARDIESALGQITFPRESHADLLGDYAQRQAVRWRVLIAAIIALIGIYLLLQAAVESWRLAALILAIVPWALAGGVLAAFIAGGGAITLGELAGLLTLFGIAMHNCIALFRHYQHLEGEGEPFGPELVLRGSRERVAPIAMTAVVTGLALLPFAVAGAIAGLEVVHSTAIVVLFGLVTSTMLTLFVMPALYLRSGGSRPKPDASSL